MSTVAIIIVVTVALVTLLAVGGMAWLLLQRMRDLTERLSRVQQRLDPELSLLARESEIASRRLEEIADAASRPRGGDDHGLH